MTTFKDDTESTVVADDLDNIDDVEPTPEDEGKVKDEGKVEDKEERAIAWPRLLAFGVLPGLALLVALGAGYFKWVGGSADDVALARTESVRAASDDAVALLSYRADSVDKDLNAARERLTGDFRDAYTTLTREVVIPGAKEKHISAVAKVQAAAPVSATANHAVVLLYVDQTVTVEGGAPTDTQPVVRMTLEKVDGRWLVSHFDPV